MNNICVEFENENKSFLFVNSYLCEDTCNICKTITVKTICKFVLRNIAIFMTYLIVKYIFCKNFKFLELLFLEFRKITNIFSIFREFFLTNLSKYYLFKVSFCLNFQLENWYTCNDWISILVQKMMYTTKII